MPPAAIGTTPPTNHTRLTSTRAPRPHGALQGQPAARSEALAPLEALAKDTRAKENDAAKAIGTHAPRGHWHYAPRPTPASPQHAHLGPMALPKGNQKLDLKPLPLLKP